MRRFAGKRPESKPPGCWNCWQHLGLLVRIAGLLAGFALTAHAIETDQAPRNPPDLSNLSPVSPASEARSAMGNLSPYIVEGRTYEVWSTAVGYFEQGIASWYGVKFHDRLTANGEVYDMYKFTAAHRTLPLPAWLKVTNLENGRWLHVRVNDRGPFHDGRVIDLSYATAYHLGMIDQGTAKVQLEYAGLERNDDESPIASRRPGQGGFGLGPFLLQVGVFKQEKQANRLAALLEFLVEEPVLLEPVFLDDQREVFRVQVGPMDSLREARKTQVLIDINLVTENLGLSIIKEVE